MTGRPVRTPPRPEVEGSRRARYAWAGRAGAAVLLAWGRTWRVDREVPEAVREIERSGERLIYAFWHAHILPLSYFYRGRGIVVLVSRHGDGEYITQVIHRLGFGTVRGSTSRGGMRALLEMARLGRDGYPLGVTPDGPRGPRQRLQPGVLLIAQRSGLPIVPLAAAMSRGRRLDSWDRFEVPAPAARIRIVAGAPLHIPRDVEASRLAAEWGERVQESIDAVERRAQEAFEAPGSATLDRRRDG